jgi:hypothetical protein
MALAINSIAVVSSKFIIFLTFIEFFFSFFFLKKIDFIVVPYTKRIIEHRGNKKLYQNLGYNVLHASLAAARVLSPVVFLLTATSFIGCFMVLCPSFGGFALFVSLTLVIAF